MQAGGLGDLLDLDSDVQTLPVNGGKVNDLLFAGLEIKTDQDEVQDMMKKLDSQIADSSTSPIIPLEKYISPKEQSRMWIPPPTAGAAKSIPKVADPFQWIAEVPIAALDEASRNTEPTEPTQLPLKQPEIVESALEPPTEVSSTEPILTPSTQLEPAEPALAASTEPAVSTNEPESTEELQANVDELAPAEPVPAPQALEESVETQPLPSQAEPEKPVSVPPAESEPQLQPLEPAALVQEEPQEHIPESEASEAEMSCSAETGVPSKPAVEENSAIEVAESCKQQEILLRRIIQALGAELGLSEKFLPEILDEASAEAVTNLLSTALKATRAAPEAASPPTSTTPTRELPNSETRNEDSPTQPDETQVPPQPTQQSAQQQAQPIAQPGTAEWEEVDEEHPAPTYGLESPVISHLLSTWTTDANKVDFLKSWVRSLYMPSYEDLNYPPGLQITNLSCVLRDGFMVLLVPLIRSLSKHAVVVHVRKHTLPAGSSGMAGAEDSFSDPFAQEESALYDVRIKRRDVTLSTADRAAVAPSAGVSAHPREDDAHRDRVHSHDKVSGAGYRTDSNDYSSLAEINASLTAIETSATRESAAMRTIHATHAAEAEAHLHEHQSEHAAVGRAASLTGETLVPTTAGQSSVSAPAVAPSHTGHAPTQPSPSILQSLYSWWDPAAASAAPAPPAAPVASPPSLERRSARIEEDAPKEDSNADPVTGAAVAAIEADQHKETDSTPPAAEKAGHETPPASERDGAGPTAAAALAANVSPVSKIAEKLQQIREQKLQYQQKNREKSQAEDK